MPGMGHRADGRKLDRLTRSVHDATGLMQRSENSGWGLVALDAPVDTTTPAGRAMAQILSVFAELERRLIGERTKAALAIKRIRAWCSVGPGRSRTRWSGASSRSAAGAAHGQPLPRG